MPIEIEAKMKVESFGPILAALGEHKATSLGEHIETDTFFDTPDRALLAADKGLRLRVALDGSTNKSEALLTHKGPVGHGPLKKRQETQTLVANAEAMGRLLEQLGFVQWLRYQKRRQSWQLDSCRVELDELPRLGKYVEIEGPSDTTVMQVREKLGLSSQALIKASYVAMLTAHLQERGENRTEVLL
jgi:adenylate cyclase, class 2